MTLAYVPHDQLATRSNARLNDIDDRLGQLGDEHDHHCTIQNSMRREVRATSQPLAR